MATDPTLELERVVAGYGKMTILNETGFRVRPGTVTTIIGPNGAGKSTVFKTVFGLLPVRSGRIRFEGRDITNLKPRALLGLGICYVPQGRNIFPELSVRHNLELGGVALMPKQEIHQRMETAMDRFPMLRRKADAQASTLSGGEQKLLEIARGLLLDPKLILIDEPSIGLSPLLAREVLGIARSLRDGGVSVLMVEQNAKSALEISDEGIVLELGQVRRQDDARAILADPRIGHLFLGGSAEGNAA
ncbi:MAG TPA: ABC transporter ATP-binding protein [Stellaceae bacterium]|nr:ABC transporter ATP-binding protein [Stellaceae bacterium]